MLRRIAITVGTVLWVSLAVVWPASYLWIPRWYGRTTGGGGQSAYREDRAGFAILDGTLSIQGSQKFAGGAEQVKAPAWSRTARAFGPFAVQYSAKTGKKSGRPFWRQGCVRVPLWAPFGLLSLPLGIIFVKGPLRGYLRQPKGLCAGCGYNLTGNESGICLECGRKVRRPRSAKAFGFLSST